MNAVLIKQPDEVRQYTFDYSAQLEVVAGETLTGSPTVTATVLNGAGSLTIGSPSISGTKVNVTISGGVLGENYAVKCLVQTNASHTLACVGELRIRNLL